MLSVETYLYNSLSESCTAIHQARLNPVLDVASGLRNSQNLSLSELGRNLPWDAKLKNKIKKLTD